MTGLFKRAEAYTMPARFVEVTNPLEAARKSGSLSYVTDRLTLNVSGWNPFNFTGFANMTIDSFSTNTSIVQRVLHAANNLSLPTGIARALILAAITLLLLQKLYLFWLARKAVAAYGHAHSE